ncbi:MAG: prepilin-type N-terminal cleavage/methylation domain-containing protein [Pseudomonadota bacterium]
MRASERGVTLIELLVGLTIISFTAGAVVLTAAPRRPPARVEAERFAAIVKQALDEAVFSGVVHRLEWTAADYRIARRKDGRWRRERALEPARRNVSFSIALAGDIVDNTEALNGGGRVGTFVGFGGPGVGTPLGETPEEADETDDVDVLALDPLGLATGFDARFEGRRATFVVIVDPNGDIEVIRE